MRIILLCLVLLSTSFVFAKAPTNKNISQKEGSTTYVCNQTTTTELPRSHVNKNHSHYNNQMSQRSVTPVVSKHHPILITVTGEGVAPMNTSSPAQAYALAKRAAVVDAYRLIAERVRGVKVEGHDYVRNMMMKRSSVRTSVYAMVRHAHIEQTTFKDGLCEVDMDILISYSQFAQ